ncbi:MAG: helicase-related protein [Gordonia sp. (in: high G+C Gram-positive bacteria)]
MPEDEAERSTASSSTSAAEDDYPDPAVALSNAKYPSSMGLTFAVAPATSPTVTVMVRARRYEENGANKWHPTETTDTHEITTGVGSAIRKEVPVADGLELTYLVRPTQAGIARITVALVNTQIRPSNSVSDHLCWFQPSIEVTANEFVDRKPPVESSSKDFDRRSASFLYRDNQAIAVGHGCAVNWDEDRPVQSVSTTFFPRHDLQLADPNVGAEGDPFGTYALYMDEFIHQGDSWAPLTSMVTAYEAWIDAQELTRKSLAGTHAETAGEHIAAARECASRIRSGIQALEIDEVRRAFCLMNEAMVAQRDAQDRARGNAPSRQQWRPFQMAFILINLPGLADPSHPDRDIADLLWFPTGGGKTEAYLGCIAFTALLRRIRKDAGDIPDDSGVSAIMRYTLRLLTRQQFERAAGLICALESIRRRSLPRTSEISLGLWVGKPTTPNELDKAKSALNKFTSGEIPVGSNPVQILECPWCGTELDSKNYSIDTSMVIACGQGDCEFGDGLPLYLIDEDIYAKRPTLLIGTVDKFAQMTWRSEVSRLLPVGTKTLPPELIIQDELHLISGPLGTMVGLYESALDAACSTAGKPKVLASTATIRRASQQVRAVFDRDSRQFPPPGLTPDDNYFARPATPEEKGTRRYVGIMAPGTSHATLLVRIYAAVLQSAAEIEVDDEVRDAYWTLLGYFNSLRVLGSTYLQVLDDIPKRIDVVAARNHQEPRGISQEPIELTSRKDQTQIPKAMRAIEQPYPSQNSPDVVLATNMISVGLDIDRLGLMVVAGQPQSTSEYIQSTSRVGRKYPGLVFVALNGQRSRDKSHYESFIPFHRALYREVEATTATPFASRARDRGVHGVLVAAARLLISGLRADRAASAVGDYTSELNEIIEQLVRRSQSIAGVESSEGTEESADSTALRYQLRNLVDEWTRAAETDRINEYGKMVPANARNQPDPNHRPLLITADSGSVSPGAYPVTDPPWATLTSMRDVDAETNLYETSLRVTKGRPGGNQ